MKKNISLLAAENKTGKAINPQELYHKMIFEVDEYAIILLDENGIIQNWNKGAEKIKQYKAEEVVGKHFSMFYFPQDRESKLPETLLRQAAITGRAVHEGWRMRKDKTGFWGSITLTAIHNESGDIIGYSKVTRDLTDRKEAEDQLKKNTEELRQINESLKSSEERYHKMIAEIEDYAIILLDKEGYIQNWNAGAEKIKGYSSTEIIGKNFREFYLPADREKKIPEMLIGQAASNGKAVHEGWRKRKDGSVFWGSIVITALHNEQGEVIGFSKVTRDLTERMEAEQKMQEYLIQLEKQNKELEQFAYIASHDLQEPLRKIQTFTSAIQNNLDDKALVIKYFEKINFSAERMSELIKSVLNYSRLTNASEHYTDTSLDEVVTHILTDFELLIEEKNATIKRDPLPVLRAYPLQMHQLFSNLINNALKFSDKTPVINITSNQVGRNDIQDPPITLTHDRYWRINIIDNGIGFDQQYADLIFSMFQRLHSKHEYTGTGIGLALCKKIMDNHNGFISATGEPGVGSNFQLYFPVE